LDGDGEDEVLISADELFQEGRQGANAIAGWELFDGVVAARRCRKSGTQTHRRRIPPKAYPKAAQEEGRFDAPNAYKVIAILDLDGDGKMEVVVGWNYTKEKRSQLPLRSEEE